MKRTFIYLFLLTVLLNLYACNRVVSTLDTTTSEANTATESSFETELSVESEEEPFEPYMIDNFFRLDSYNGQEYLLHEPTVKKVGRKYPVLVHLHGYGEHAYIKDSPFYSVGAELLNGILWRINENPDYYESYVILPVSTEWGPLPYNLKGMIDAVVENGSGDPDRVYITGVSMGGFATTDFLFNYPEMVACAVPLSGANYTSDNFADIVNIPIRIYHSADDSVVSVTNSRSFFNNIINAGGNNATYSELEGFGHYPYAYVYTQTDMIDWMYSKKR